MSSAAPPGPYASYVTSSYVTPSSSPVPFLTARSMLSSGMFSALAASMAVRSRALPAGSPAPCLAAIVISRISLVKSAPRRASVTAFFRLICFHLLWPAMAPNLQRSPIRVEHVLEPHPAPVEVQVHEAGRAVAVLEHDQFRGAVYPVARIVHLFAVQPEHEIRVLLDRPQVAEVVERGPRVRTLGVEPGQLRHHDERHLALERQCLEPLQPQRQCRLAGADVAAQHHEVAPTQAPPQQAIDGRETRGDGVARHVARALLIHPLDEGLGGRGRAGEALRKAAAGHALSAAPRLRPSALPVPPHTPRLRSP